MRDFRRKMVQNSMMIWKNRDLKDEERNANPTDCMIVAKPPKKPVTSTTKGIIL
jgi:hypothetical protein